jgi:hypothetical protein
MPRNCDRARVMLSQSGLGRLGRKLVSVWTPLMNEEVRAALVLLAEHRASVAGANRNRADRVRRAARFVRPLVGWRLCRCNLPLRAHIYWYSDQPMADDRAPSYTLSHAASSERTQAFLRIGTLFLLPVLFVYSGWSGWSYWVFRGKVRANVGYY